MLLTDIVEKNAKKFPDKTALVMKMRYRTVSLSYKEVYELSVKIACFLEKQGVEKGDTILILAPNSPYWVCIFWGTLLRGAVLVPLNVQSTPQMIEKISQETEAKIFFKHMYFRHEATRNLRTFDVDFIQEDVQGVDSSHFVETKASPGDLVEIIYTSGTTGDPKGVMLTHKNIYSVVAAIDHLISIAAHDRFLSILPLSHIFEQVVEFRVLAAGAFIVYTPALSSSLIKKTLKEYRVNKMAAVPEFLKRIIARIESEAERKGKARILAFLFSFTRIIPLRVIRRIIFSNIHKQFGSKLDLIVSGGAVLDATVAKKWQAIGVRIIQGYGLTETSSVVSLLSAGDSNILSVGKIVPGVEIRIAEDKEILVRGPNVTQGYYKNEVKTKEAFTDEGWFRTGDLGYLDKNGYLYIRGRKKFMILTPAGQNVYPEDIEAELNKESGVKDSAVVGLEKDGTILIHAELLGDIKNLEEVIARVNQRLASFQQIQSWSVWPLEDFPRTITRKVKKHEVLD